MSVISKRELSRKATYGTALGLISASAFQLQANPLGQPIGCQTYPVRKLIAADFPGALKQLYQAGFQAVELCSPFGYADFAPVGKYKPAELQGLLDDINLKCVSSHFSTEELRNDLPGRIEWAKALGLTQMIVPTLRASRS